MALEALDQEVRDWVEQLTGGSIVGVERQGRWRPHFFVEVALSSGAKQKMLLRFSRDPHLVKDSCFLSHFSLEHEAHMLEVLQKTDVLTPAYYGYNAEHDVILMGCVAGSNEFSAEQTPAARRPIIREYIENLAALHRHDVDKIDVERNGLTIPRTAKEIAIGGKFQFMEKDYRAARPRLRPEPLIDFGIWWIHNHVPVGSGRISLVQGDTGPGQFMHADGRLTALIDWELSHIGDPMLDLGVMRMRNQLYPIGELAEYLDHYAAVSGTPLQRETLIYYTVLSMLLTPMGMAATIQSPSVAIDSMLARFGWDVVLRRGLCDALAEAHGLSIDRPTIPEPATRGGTDLNGFLVDYLEQLCVPQAAGEYAEYLLSGATGIAATLALRDAIGPELAEADLADMAELLGERPADRDAGIAALQALVDSAPEASAPGLIKLFARIESRREALWAPLMIAQSRQPYEALRVRD